MTDPGTVSAEHIRLTRPALGNALVKMLAYQAAMGSKTAYYHYPLDDGDQRYAIRRGLLATREGPSHRRLLRLTKFGREVAQKYQESRKPRREG